MEEVIQNNRAYPQDLQQLINYTGKYTDEQFYGLRMAVCNDDEKEKGLRAL